MSFCRISIGHATNDQHHTGCTVFLCPEKTVGSADVRGPAPGSRETALLAPDKPVKNINGIVLAGGSAFGLAAADGAMRFFGERNIGHITPVRPIPIVPAAIIYDLSMNGGRFAPDAQMGYEACLNATLDEPAQGNVGVGAGATVGKWGGFAGAMKGGFGLATLFVDELEVCAAAVVNSVGDVVNEDGSVLAGARVTDSAFSGYHWKVEQDPYRRFAARPPANLGTNTTLVVVATNADLDKVSCYRLAQLAHDGIAIAIRPAHTTHDGDMTFTLATGRLRQSPLDVVANLALHVVAEAIRNAVRSARSIDEIVGLAG